MQEMKGFLILFNF